MANKFETGDIVKLKTGSPSMTVKGNATRMLEQVSVSISDKYECTWSDGTKTQTAVFSEDVLQIHLR